MFIVQDYSLAILFCVVTMLCWGSWGNTQKLASKTWRYEFFYWDYVIGVLLFSVFSAFTLGSFGSEGQGFLFNLAQADMRSLGSAFLGGIIFNAANILLSAAIAICGLSVAFPVGIGLALVLGVLVNYFGAAKGEPLYIFIGVALIAVAILLNGLAYKKALVGSKKVSGKGLFISVAAGVIMAFFYRFVAASMDLDNFAEQPLLQTAYEIARWHHERWDGRGYPDGLKGDEIPISAQLVSLADVYDALTSERCYKKAFSHEKAVQMILNSECGAFNPLLLQCLTDIQADLKEELQQRN